MDDRVEVWPNPKQNLGFRSPNPKQNLCSPSQFVCSRVGKPGLIRLGEIRSEMLLKHLLQYNPLGTDIIRQCQL